MQGYVVKSGLKQLLGALLLTFLCLNPVSSYANEDRGRVVYLRGAVTATDSTGVPRLLRQDSRIMPGDEIETGDKGVIQLIFPDGSMLHVKRSSKVVVEAYRYSPGQPAEDKVVIKAVKGGFRSLTGALGKRNPEKVEYKTPVATIGVRGTAVEIDADGRGVSVASFDFGAGVIVTGDDHTELASGQSGTVQAQTRQIDVSRLQRAADDPAVLASTIVQSQHVGGIANARAICGKLGAENVLLLIAIERHAPEFVTDDLLASIQGLAGCLDVDVAAPMLTVGSAVYPESADRLLAPAVKGGLNISIALDGVLRGMDNAAPEMVERVIADAIKNGITMAEARRILVGLREDGICR